MQQAPRLLLENVDIGHGPCQLSHGNGTRSPGTGRMTNTQAAIMEIRGVIQTLRTIRSPTVTCAPLVKILERAIDTLMDPSYEECPCERWRLDMLTGCWEATDGPTADASRPSVRAMLDTRIEYCEQRAKEAELELAAYIGEASALLLVLKESPKPSRAQEIRGSFGEIVEHLERMRRRAFTCDAVAEELRIIKNHVLGEFPSEPRPSAETSP